MQESTCHWNARAFAFVDANGKIVRKGKVASEPEVAFETVSAIAKSAPMLPRHLEMVKKEMTN